MAIVMKGEGVDVGATLKHFDERIAALEGKTKPATDWTPAPPTRTLIEEKQAPRQSNESI